MHTANNVLKWSAFISGMTSLMVLGGIFSIWLMIEVLVLLAGITD